MAAALLLLAGVACARDPNVQKKNYMDSGNKYFEEEKYREAAIQYANAVQIDSGYVEAHYRLSETYIRLNDVQRAYAELQRTVELDPNHTKAQLDLGNLLLAGRQFEEAQKRADTLLEKDPKNADAHSLAANLAAAQRKPEEALEHIQAAIELDPKRWQFYQTLALIQSNTKKYAEAEASMKKAIELAPAKTAGPRMTLASLYQQQERWAEAEAALRQAMDAEPENIAARVAYARFLMLRNRKADAEEVMRKAKNDFREKPEGYMLLAEFYVATREMEKALQELASLRQEYPKDRRVAQNYASLLLLNNRLDEAGKVIDSLLAANAKDTDALILKGDLQNRRQDPEAAATLESALKLAPDSAAAHYQLGLARMLEGKLDGAESEIRSALKLQPNALDAKRALAMLVMRKGDFAELQRLGNEIVELRPEGPEGYLIRAAALFAKKDFAGTEKDVKKAIEVAPGSPAGYLRLGSLRLAQNRTAEANSAFEQALERDAGSAEALEGIMRIHLQNRQPQKALARIDSQMQKEPNNSNFHYLKGVALTASEDFPGAEQSLEKAVSLDKNNVNAVLMLGQLQVRMGNVDRAIANYEKRVAAEPNDVRFLFLIASLEEGRGNSAKAEQLYQKILALQPNYAPAANNLAYLMLTESKNLDVALSLAQVARQGMPDLPHSADTLGWAYYNKALYGLAVDLLEEAVRKAPQNATYHYHLGMAYQKKNEPGRARMHLEKTLQLDPKYAKAGEIRELLRSLKG
jgi:tetratricopeptide (TPR) repeat protein